MGYSTMHQWIIERIQNIQKWLVFILYYRFFQLLWLNIGCVVTTSSETCVIVSGLQPQQGYKFEVLLVILFAS